MTRKLIITGVSNGIGAYLATQAHEAGYDIVGLSRTKPEASWIDWRCCDVSDPDSVKSAVLDLKRDENLYGLINAAGIASMNFTISTPPETANRIIAVNLMGTIYCCSLIGKWLARRGVGRIINFSTIAVPLAIKGESIYAASKAGIETFSRSFAREMGDFAITVNVIAPGPMDTKLIAKVPKEYIDRIVQQQLIRKMGTPADVWNIASFLLSDASSMVTGDVMHVGGA